MSHGRGREKRLWDEDQMTYSESLSQQVTVLSEGWDNIHRNIARNLGCVSMVMSGNE